MFSEEVHKVMMEEQTFEEEEEHSTQVEKHSQRLMLRFVKKTFTNSRVLNENIFIDKSLMKRTINFLKIITLWYDYFLAGVYFHSMCVYELRIGLRINFL